jgi:hypothetical protein
MLAQENGGGGALRNQRPDAGTAVGVAFNVQDAAQSLATFSHGTQPQVAWKWASGIEANTIVDDL